MNQVAGQGQGTEAQMPMLLVLLLEWEFKGHRNSWSLHQNCISGNLWVLM